MLRCNKGSTQVVYDLFHAHFYHLDLYVLIIGRKTVLLFFESVINRFGQP